MENKGETLLRRRERGDALGHQEAKPSRSETQRAKSRPRIRQVSDKSRLVCLKMAEERDSPALPCSIRKGLGTGTAGK